jgi:uncharacterized protein
MTEIFVDINVYPDQIDNPDTIRELALKKAGQTDLNEIGVRVVRRSVDARSRRPKFILRVVVGKISPEEMSESIFKPAKLGNRHAVIVGAGPAGYFAAMTLLENGILPIVLERGKEVTARRKDIKKIYSQGLINPHSNYCFGEGGAGTFSDGKLFTRANKRGNVGRILGLFVAHGADSDILINAHPHIGSNVLPKIVRQMRESILGAGGIIRFDTFVDDLLIKDRHISGVRVNGDEIVEADSVILATGHSARDIYSLLIQKGIPVEAKPFALGVRIEHPQEIIDKIFYHHSPRNSALPAASYRISCQADGRGVFSFCMCPGGYVIPASTAPGELVLNGMSMANRGAPYANAGLVVETRLEDIGYSDDPLVALSYQSTVEKNMFLAGDGITQKAPAQKTGDFIQGKMSGDLGETSYIPGIYSAPLNELLPEPVVRRLRLALQTFGQKYRGFDTNESKLLGVESRTSSPIRIIRDSKTFMHPAVQGLYPCSEGAGYAGGIVSAAMDGEAVARAVVRND